MVKLMSVYGEDSCQIHFVQEDGEHESGFSLLDFALGNDDLLRLFKYSGIDTKGGLDLNDNGSLKFRNER